MIPVLKCCVFGLLVCSALPVGAQIVAPTPDAQQTGPSFDCTKARGRAEKMICADSHLGSLDRRVAHLFAIALSQATDAGDAKRQQRRWLGDRDDCKDAACIEQSYRARIEQLSMQTGRFSTVEAHAVCERFTDPETRAQTLASKAGADDINNDGVTDRVAQCDGGTANIPCVGYADQEGKPLPIRPDGFEWVTYSAFGRASFRVDGRTFTYYARDNAFEQPAYISYVTPTNREVRICDFDTTVGSAVLEGGDEVCAAIEGVDARIESLELAPVGDASTYAINRPDTQARAVGKIDIDNDGLEESLIEYSYSSGGGRGCEVNYFELLSDDGKTPAMNSNAAAVRELQGIDTNGAHGRSCGLITNRLFRFGDEIYFETNTGNEVGALHEVKILHGEAVQNVCAFERQIRSTVKTIY